ncbi:MAG: DNA polymerase III subunit alpha [Bacteroidetes bacterium]|nr:DNA polymerase III subunit alpha [Bacteroidota bacterium]
MSYFVHLHNHTDYSLLDGAATVASLIEAAVEQQMPAVALTDHGVLFGAIEFYKRAKNAGIKPILGFEAYIVPFGSRFERKLEKSGKEEGRNYNHILLLAKNEQGYKNLMKLSTRGYTEGFYYKPRIDFELLEQYHEGIIATTACRGGIVNHQLLMNNDSDAEALARKCKDIFGEDFYFELQNHGLLEEQVLLEKVPKLAKKIGCKLVATNDCHYIKKEHAIPHNILLNIPDATSTYTPDYMNLRYKTDQLYFKSASEMQKIFKSLPEALHSTIEIAEKCTLQLELKKSHMPLFPLPEGANAKTPDEYFEQLVWQGITQRYKEITPTIEERVNHEINVIKRMGFASYFLIVQDFVRAAREMGVRVGPGRGSAAGSIVSYALHITEIDPLHYDLLFERFLNPDRVSMPDIDIDFADNKRELVIEYVKRKYGERCVGQIVTFGTLGTRAVIKDVGRVLGIPLSVLDSISKQIPMSGKELTIDEALALIPELQWVKESTDEKIQLLIKTSRVLEGMNRNVSIHPAGVVITPGDISDYVPMYKTSQNDFVTQYNMKDLEDAGLLKIDFLGLRTLTVIENAIKLIQENHGVSIDTSNIPDGDPITFELFSRGRTVALFQFESSGMQDYLRKLRPTKITDLVAMNALYRPGPMDNIPVFIERKEGRQPITYLHPKLEPILKETYGIIVYQEQVMRIASEIAGMSLAQADLLRRAMGKKDKALMAQQKSEFTTKAIQRGIEKSVAEEIFDLIEKFAEYGFNKSHSVAYSVLAYQTGYLKAHYPAEYMAATLSSEIANTDKIVVLIDECRKMGIHVLAPDVNESNVDFSVTPHGIRFGLSAIKNVGVEAVKEIVRARNEQGKYIDIFDFVARVDLRLVNKKTIESLVLAGAFDSLHNNRSQLIVSLESILAYGQTVQEHKNRGQSSLFDAQASTQVYRPLLKVTEPWSEREVLEKEKSVLGFYVSGHPLLKYREEIDGLATARLGNPDSVRPNTTIRVCGIITDLKKKIDKRGKTMAFLTIEDFTGKAECIAFADIYQKYSVLLQPGTIVMLVGKNDGSEDAIKVIINEVIPIEEVRAKFTKSVYVTIDLNTVTEDQVYQFVRLVRHYSGNCVCYMYFTGGNLSKNTLYYSRYYKVNPIPEFTNEIRKLFGDDSLRLEG